MIRGICAKCGARFDCDPYEHPQTLCLGCWIVDGSAPLTNDQRAQVLAELKARVDALFRLCNPRDHKPENVELAYDMSVWLNGLRRRLGLEH